MSSPSNFPRNRRAEDDRRDLGALTRLARDLAGTLRPPSIIDTLMDALGRHFGARLCGLSLYDIDSDRLEVRHGDPDRDPYLVPLLDVGMRRGPMVLPSEEVDRLPAGAPPAWIAAPIISKSVIVGALAIGRDSPPFTDDDLALL
jgi:GAF domain-containing protein